MRKRGKRKGGDEIKRLEHYTFATVFSVMCVFCSDGDDDHPDVHDKSVKNFSPRIIDQNERRREY